MIYSIPTLKMEETKVHYFQDLTSPGEAANQ